MNVWYVKPGGAGRVVQRDAEGNEFAFHGVYHAIETPVRLVRTFEFEGTPGHVLLETVTFEDLGGRTNLIDQSVFQTAEDRDAMLRLGMEEGAAESMDRLAALLAKG
ncbi:SRPBCC domain-containing protein [Methanoregula sp.]|uniref:SRPBCC domain-containing protein n=1 Tax=Methanoregula sp. TaxID=2052170 RepID=UPI003C74B91C